MGVETNNKSESRCQWGTHRYIVGVHLLGLSGEEDQARVGVQTHVVHLAVGGLDGRQQLPTHLVPRFHSLRRTRRKRLKSALYLWLKKRKTLLQNNK